MENILFDQPELSVDVAQKIDLITKSFQAFCRKLDKEKVWHLGAARLDAKKSSGPNQRLWCAARK